MAGEHQVGSNRQRSGSQLNRAYKGRVELALVARTENMELKPKPLRGKLRPSRCGFGLHGIGGIDEQGNDSDGRHHFVKQIQQLRCQLHVQRGHAGNIAARSVEAGNEANFHRVLGGREDDRNRRGCPLGGERRRCAKRGDHGDLTTHQIGCLLRQPIIVALRPAVFDRHILAFDVTGLLQTLAERGDVGRIPVGRCAIEPPYHRLILMTTWGGFHLRCRRRFYFLGVFPSSRKHMTYQDSRCLERPPLRRCDLRRGTPRDLDLQCEPGARADALVEHPTR
jgi:hypothetical protein